MTAVTPPCSHPPTGVVTSLGDRTFSDHPHAEAPVCGLQECIDEATAWVSRMTRKPARHMPDPKTQQGGGGEGDGALLGLVTVTEGGQQGLGTCSPGTTNSPEVAS